MVWTVNDTSLYNPAHLVVRNLYDSDHVAIVWFGFVKGQSLRDHETTSVAVVQVLHGRILLTTDQDQELLEGQAVELKPNQRHALMAVEDSVVQLLLIPHPRYHSLAEQLDLPKGSP